MTEATTALSSTNLFWLEETDLPPGSGYDLFGPWHLLSLAAAVSFIAFFSFIYRREQKSQQDIILKAVSVLLVALEVLKTCVLSADRRMGIGHLPLHLCSMSIYIYPIIAFSKNRKIQSFLGEISACTLLPAAVAALLFPDWTMYPVVSFMNLDGYMWHAIQVLFPILLLISGKTRPDISHYWRNISFLAALAVPIYAFDLATRCNYWFLLRPVPGTPLEAVYKIAGPSGYILALAAIASAVILSMYGIYRLIKLFLKPEIPSSL